MKPVVRATMLSCVALAFSSASMAAEEAGTAPPVGDANEAVFSMKLVSVETPKSLKVFGPADHGTMGSGAIVKAPAPAGMMFVKGEDGATYSFLAGKIEPTDETKLFVSPTFEVRNGSDTPRSFRVGDIVCKTRKGERRQFSAVGQGSSPLFAKFSDVEKQAAEAVTISLGPNQQESLGFLFGAEKNEVPLRCSFQGGPWMELRR